MMAETKPVSFVCRGRIYVGGKMYISLHAVDNPDKQLNFLESKTNRNLSPGCIYDIEADDSDGSYSAIFSTAKYKGRVPQEEAAQYEALDQTARITKSSKAKEKDETTPRRAMLKLMMPLRIAYTSTNWEGQRALEVLVLECLRRNPRDDELSRVFDKL